MLCPKQGKAHDFSCFASCPSVWSFFLTCKPCTTSGVSASGFHANLHLLPHRRFPGLLTLWPSCVLLSTGRNNGTSKAPTRDKALAPRPAAACQVSRSCITDAFEPWQLASAIEKTARQINPSYSRLKDRHRASTTDKLHTDIANRRTRAKQNSNRLNNTQYRHTSK